jgi:carboxyl-terminal processing protease
MNLRSFIIVGLLLGTLAYGIFSPEQDPKEKEGLILHAVLNYLDALHFEPVTLDNDFAEKTFDAYLESTDPGKRFLIQSEVDKLAFFKTDIDDQVRLRTFEFFDFSVGLIEESYKRAEDIYTELIDHPFDFDKSEEIELSPEKRAFASDEIELKDFWRKYLKYEVLIRLEKKIEDQEKAANKETEVEDSDEEKAAEPVEIKTRAELEKESIEEVKETFDDWFIRLKKIKRSDRFESYINAITHIFDPHTDYLNYKEKQDFDIRMGGKLEGIGARLSPEGEFIKIVSIVPGGPAWKGKELEVNDVITVVSEEGKEPLDIKGMTLPDVVVHIRGDKGTNVTLTVTKADGSIKDITIERDEVIIDEGFARSAILNKEGNDDKIGYIKLPRFYSSFEGNKGNSCSADVKKELEKLNAQNVDGVILDLRNNGGGSLRDVISMSGLFIKDGPIVQVKPKDKKPSIYRDTDNGVVYDGPLIVMVNNYSASASEILAAALQDYGRAVVVGSNSTFGKGTVQRFFNLDDAYKDKGNDDYTQLGELKVTMQKFYRINGGSTQLNGVTPDVILPDNYHYLDLGEKEYDYAMDWSVIDPVEYGQDVFTVENKDDLIRNSAERLAKNDEFKLILENAKRLKKNRDISTAPLSLEDYIAYLDQREKEAKQFEDIMEDVIADLEISNLPDDVEYINSDESRVARNDDWIKSLSKDIYIDETLKILSEINKKDLVERP